MAGGDKMRSPRPKAMVIMALISTVAFLCLLGACEPAESDKTDRVFAEFAAQWVPDDGCHYVIESSDAATTPDACYPSLEGTPFAGQMVFEKLAKTYIGTYLDNDDRRIEITCRPGGDDWVAPHKIEIDDPSLADPCTYFWRMPVWLEIGDDRVKGSFEIQVHPSNEPPTTPGNIVLLSFDVTGQFHDASHEFGENPIAWRFWHPDPDERWIKID